jgi:hypothetical protein
VVALCVVFQTKSEKEAQPWSSESKLSLEIPRYRHLHLSCGWYEDWGPARSTRIILLKVAGYSLAWALYRRCEGRCLLVRSLLCPSRFSRPGTFPLLSHWI